MRQRSPQGKQQDETPLALGSAPVSAARAASAPGVRIGPYVLERLLGSGGMGVVYAARDPRLDRLVALKLLRHIPAVGREQLSERLRRESRALARLSHPNVTVVYELDASGDEVYIAMEYVAGTTLRAWLLETRRKPREILAKLSAAGRGLAAAHAAGLVHRDFKPDNVLLGSDGSVKVTDFGLARLAEEVCPHEPLTANALLEELTITGAILGSPAYMAPEQFAATAVDARADQFAFCVALFEALFGRRPFVGATVDELRVAVLAGTVEVPRVTGVPPRVRRALIRGLAVAPGDRFASMSDLLAAITPRRGGLAVGLAAAAMVAGIAVGGSLWSRSSSPPCRGADAEVQGVWNPARRESVHAALVATHAPGAAESASVVEQGLDAYLARWAKMQGEACEATHVHRQQSEAVLDLRTGCLESARSEVDALVHVLAHADSDVALHAREAIGGLPDLSRCADIESLERRVPIPRDVVGRKRYERLREHVDEARVKVSVAHYDEALPLLLSIIADPGLTDLPELEAEAQHARGKLLTVRGAYLDAEAALFRGLVRAQAARADDLIATIAVDLAQVVGFNEQRPADGERWAELAAAANRGNDLLEVRLDTVRAGILQRQGRLVDAEALVRKAVAVAGRRAPGSAVEAESWDALGMNLSMQGKFDESIPVLHKAVALTIEVYGAAHSVTATTRMNLANALSATQHYDEALAEYREALAADEAMFGPDNVRVAQVLSNMGQMLQEQKKLPEAHAALDRALAIREKALGNSDPAVARTLANIGYVQLDERAYAQALEQFTRADAIVEHALGPQNPARADITAGVGLALLGLHRPAEAIAPLSSAVELSTKPGGDPVNLASIQASLAHALHASHRDPARAFKLATAARKVLVEAGESEDVAELDAWLSPHP